MSLSPFRHVPSALHSYSATPLPPALSAATAPPVSTSPTHTTVSSVAASPPVFHLGKGRLQVHQHGVSQDAAQRLPCRRPQPGYVLSRRCSQHSDPRLPRAQRTPPRLGPSTTHPLRGEVPKGILLPRWQYSYCEGRATRCCTCSHVDRPQHSETHSLKTWRTSPPSWLPELPTGAT